MGRPRQLPDPEPRPCRHCGATFTPRRKSANLGAVYCSLACQRAGVFDLSSEAQRERASRPRPTLRVEHPATYKKVGARHEHRLIAERKLGRPLEPGEVVHHIDGDRHNNAEENIAILPSQAEHARIHATGRKHRPDSIEKMRQAATGKKASPETIEKLRQAARARWDRKRGESQPSQGTVNG